jgi:hypothetical protein
MLTDLEKFAASQGVFPSAGELSDFVMKLFPEEGMAIADTLDSESPSARGRAAMATPAPVVEGHGTGTHDESLPTSMSPAHLPAPKVVQNPPAPTRAARRKAPSKPTLPSVPDPSPTREAPRPSVPKPAAEQKPALGDGEAEPTEARGPPPRRSVPKPQAELDAEDLEVAELSKSFKRSSSRGALVVTAVALTVMALGTGVWLVRDLLAQEERRAATQGDAQPVEPIARGETPPAEKPAPEADKPAPVAEKPTPVAEKPTPVAEKPTPVAEKPTPVAEKPTPVAEKPTPPVAEKPAPVAAKPAPAPKATPKPPPVATRPQVSAPPSSPPKPVAAAPKPASPAAKGPVSRVTVPGPTDKGTGLVRVRCASDALDVFVDGNKVGRTPLDMQVPVGAHNIELRAPGAGAGPLQRINVAFDSEYTVEAN